MTDRFRRVGERILDALLEDDPEWASQLGDARFADRLTDRSEEADAARAGLLADALGALDEIDDTLLPPDDRVDLETLRLRVSADLWRDTELRPHTWDPLASLPGEAFDLLIERDGTPPADRLTALAGRCAELPGRLETARARLGSGPGMPRVHAETAAARARGLAGMLARLEEAPGAPLEREPALRGRVEAARDEAAAALLGHAVWLSDRAEAADADPRLGERGYAARLWYELDCEITPDTLLVRAESDLIALEERIAELAAEHEGRPRRPGQAREVLDRIAAERATGPGTGRDVRAVCEEALEHLRARVPEAGIATVPELPVRVAPMPESRRGAAAGYCDPPGPLAPRTGEATVVAVAPPPDDWPEERRRSFHREYSVPMLREFMAHEALPGHALQLAHAAGRTGGGTRIRLALRSGPFVEGWALHAETLLAEEGWGLPEREEREVRLMNLKMRLRAAVNAVLDVRVHAHGMTEGEAMRLLVERGHCEEAEAAGKWRRALLTSGQLATYQVGHAEVAALAADLAAARPGTPRVRLGDALLSHGCPAPRHLRTLLGL
ncbi:DUF885 domain-containing protein [Nocardiopsis potens]|uniref:DUF885 domain-containing protein n=1 Tax=Nocardiopsis potens TaxID=1246458 RepID=UPI00037E56A2